MRVNMPVNSSALSRDGHRLVQLGVALLLFVTLQGLVIQNFAVPSLGRSAHTVALSSGLVLLGIGLIWPRLTLGATATRIAFWFLIYSLLVTIVVFLLAAMWGAGNTVLPLAAGASHGTALQENIITVALVSTLPTGIIAFALILWGLRGSPAT
jgi:hydroxylaminobenzene mutase